MLSSMSLAPFIAWLGVLGFAAASFFFALAETALFSLGKWRARQLAERSPGLGGSVAALLNEPQDLLATIVLGNTLANSALIALAVRMPEAWALRVAGPMIFFVRVSRPLRQVAQRLNEAWQRARIIVDSGSGHSAPIPAPTPAPTP